MMVELTQYPTVEGCLLVMQAETSSTCKGSTVNCSPETDNVKHVTK